MQEDGKEALLIDYEKVSELGENQATFGEIVQWHCDLDAIHGV